MQRFQIFGRNLSRLALALAPIVAAAHGSAETIYGLTNTNIVTFESTRPSTLLDAHAITGTVGDEAVSGMDVRPSNGKIYGVSVRAGFPNQIYTLDATTGIATFVATLNTTPLVPLAVDFDPVTDRLRIVDYGSGRSVSVNVDTGDAVEDPQIVFAPGDPRAGRHPAVTDIAYSNNSAGASTSTPYGVEGGGDAALVTLDTGTGTLRTVGLLGILSASGSGFDISGLTDIAYFATGNNTPLPPANRFYTLDLQTGQATLVGVFNNSAAGFIVDVAAAAPQPVPEASTSCLICIGCGLLFACRRRLNACARRGPPALSAASAHSPARKTTQLHLRAGVPGSFPRQYGKVHTSLHL